MFFHEMMKKRYFLFNTFTDFVFWANEHAMCQSIFDLVLLPFFIYSGFYFQHKICFCLHNKVIFYYYNKVLIFMTFSAIAPLLLLYRDQFEAKVLFLLSLSFYEEKLLILWAKSILGSSGECLGLQGIELLTIT